MSNTKKLTLSAMITALCTAALFLGNLLPNLSLSMAALAGIFPAAVVIVCGYGWAAGVYVSATLLGMLLLPNKGAAALFLCFFGHYPIWKALIEAWQTREKKTAQGWAAKLLGVCLCLLVMYFAFRGLLFSGSDPILFSGDRGWITSLLFLGLVIGYVVYDIAFSILIGYFRVKILPRLQ